MTSVDETRSEWSSDRTGGHSLGAWARLLGGLLIMFVFQGGYAVVVGIWFRDDIGRHWLGFPAVPAAVSAGVIGGALALVTTRWGRPSTLRTLWLGVIASCLAFIMMFASDPAVHGPLGIEPAVWLGLMFGLLCAPLWVALALLLRSK